MSLLGQWLDSLLIYIARFIPRFTYIPSCSRAVIFVGKNKIKEKHGLIIWWPLRSQMFSYNITDQSRELRNQALITLDNIPITLLIVCKFFVSNPIQCATKCLDYKEILDNAARQTIAKIIITKKLADIKVNYEQINQMLDKQISKEMAEYGISVYTCYISDLTISIPLKIWKSEEDTSQYSSYTVHE